MHNNNRHTNCLHANEMSYGTYRFKIIIYSKVLFIAHFDKHINKQSKTFGVFFLKKKN